MLFGKKKRKSSGYGYGYYHYGYGRRAAEDDRGALCDKMSFTSAEAYKMLRTKLNLLIPQELSHDDADLVQREHACWVIGVTSSMRGEGKTTTSINLSYTIAETQKKVCLIEADMRLPNISKRLGLRKMPGLSNVLSGQCGIKHGLQRYASKNGVSFHVITSGDIPPLPSELLESQNMETLLRDLKNRFDVIIIDLPPVTAVTDALTVAPRLTGMLVVARQNYCDKRLLADTMEQLSMTDTKVLGVVFNCSDGPISSPGRYKRYGRYGKYGRYGGSYDQKPYKEENTGTSTETKA